MKWFFFHIFVLMFSSIMVFLFMVMGIAQCCMIIPNIPIEYVLIGIMIGLTIGVFLIITSITALYKTGTRVKIQE